MKRSQPPRRTRVKRSNPGRKAKQFARCYHSAERVQFVRSLHCIAFGCNRTPCENAHTTGGGMGRKSDYTAIVPLCPAHHADMHAVGASTFERRCNGDYREHTAAVEALWQASQRPASDLTPLSAILPAGVAGLVDPQEESA